MSSKLHQSSRVLNLCRACHPLLYVTYLSVHPKYMPYFAQQIQLPWCHSHSQPACFSLGWINESSLQTTQQRQQKCHLNPWPWRWNGSQYLTTFTLPGNLLCGFSPENVGVLGMLILAHEGWTSSSLWLSFGCDCQYWLESKSWTIWVGRTPHSLQLQGMGSF